LTVFCVELMRFKIPERITEYFTKVFVSVRLFVFNYNILPVGALLSLCKQAVGPVSPKSARFLQVCQSITPRVLKNVTVFLYDQKLA